MGMHLNARELLSWPMDRVWDLPDERLMVEFDDGVTELLSVDLKISWHLWLFQRLYSKTPLLKQHAIPQKRVATNTMLDIMGDMAESCWLANNESIDKEILMKIVSVSSNDIHNQINGNLEAYVATMSIIDCLDIMEHPKAAAVLADRTPNRKTVENIYEVLLELLMDENELLGNPIAEATKAGLLPKGQVLQTIGVRGFITDVDQRMFNTPCMQNYVEGMTTLYYNLAESRSASKSLGLTKDPLKIAEYTSRRLQLVTMTLKNLHPGDCGSTEYINFNVTAKNLSAITGAHYHTDEGQKTVRKNDRFLIGTVIKKRSVLHCWHPDASGVCSACYGMINMSVPHYTNIGWVAVVELARLITQILLSNKHLDMSVAVDDVVLTDYEQHYLRVEPENNRIWVSRRMEPLNAHIQIAASEVPGLGDISIASDINTINVQNISGVTDILMKYEDDRSAVLNVASGKRLASLTHKALEYIKRVGYSLTDSGNYIIDLKDWDYSEALFELPLRHANMVDFANDFIAMVIGKKEDRRASNKILADLKPLRTYASPIDALMALYNLVSSRLDVNLVHLECIILALSSRDPENLDYRLPEPGKLGTIAPYNDTMGFRSLAPLLSYQRQQDILFNPITTVIKVKPSHPMDPLFQVAAG